IAVAFFLAIGYRLAKARNDLSQAKSAMTSAKTSVISRQTDQANASLNRAAQSLRSAHAQSVAFPLGLVKPVPLAGSPARAIDGTVKAGFHAVAAGRLLAGAAAGFPTGGKTGLNGHDLTAI